MKGFNRYLLPAAITAASLALPAGAATDAERIRILEDQLKQQKSVTQQQQQSLDAVDAELKRLKAGQPADTTTSAFADSQKDALSVTIYGFVQADMMYDFKRVDPDWDDTLRVSTIPTKSGTYGRDGDFIFGVRQSRLGVKGNYGDDITFMLEAELFGTGGDAGQTTPRLRHAWATYKNFGMGQTWSNFMDIDIFPNTIDYWGPTGMVFYRNQQARYTFPMGKDEFSVSIEDPDTSLSVGRFTNTDSCSVPGAPPTCDGSFGDNIQAKNDLPDLTARYRNNGDFGHFQVAGIVRKLGYENLNTGNKDHEVGWGVNTSAGINTWGSDVLKLQVAVGEGIGNYMNDGGLDLAPDSVNINQADAEVVGLVGISAYYDHSWNERWSSTIGWSMTDLDTTNGMADNEFKKGQIATVNLLHYPKDNIMLGTEFGWGEREDVDGNTGQDYRIQFSLKVSFDTGDLMKGRTP